MIFDGFFGEILAGTPRSDWRRSLRKPPATSAAAAAEPRTPTVYDWFVRFCSLFLANNSFEMLMLVASDLKSLYASYDFSLILILLFLCFKNQANNFQRLICF